MDVCVADAERRRFKSPDGCHKFLNLADNVRLQKKHDSKSPHFFTQVYFM